MANRTLELCLKTQNAMQVGPHRPVHNLQHGLAPSVDQGTIKVSKSAMVSGLLG